MILNGGRGGDYGEMGGGFNHADRRGRKSKNGSIKYPAEFNVGGKNRSYDKTLSLFASKYGDADHEYGITVDENGFTYKHVEGDSTSVAISGDKGLMVVHNHPLVGGNFSDSDLIGTALEKSSGIVAVSKGTNKIYTFTKGNHFNAEGFVKALKKAKWPTKYDYNTGADWWLRKNAKAYGYTYTAQKIK